MKKIKVRCGFILTLLVSVASNAIAATDPFYIYSGSTPLSSIPLGTVVAKRTVTYNLVGVPTPLTALQLVYRTNNARMQPVVNVTTVLKSPVNNGKAISYQSYYDSLNPYDAPSRVIAGNRDISKVFNLGGFVVNSEAAVPIAQLLLAGYNIIVPDTEGQTADFAAGPEYGMVTLDSIRAATHTPTSGLQPLSPVAMIGYSGGAIATNWAAQLAPTYAPDVNKILVGAAQGGVLVNPAHNVYYVNGSTVWGGIVPTTLLGLSRAYGADFTPYLSSKGLSIMEDIKDQSILYILPRYAGLQFETLFKPEYAKDLNKIPPYVKYINKVNAGLVGSPTIPMLIVQGTLGAPNGTFKLEPGDGVMMSNDVRALAKKFCLSGTDVKYGEVALDHFATTAVWIAQMVPWLNARFAGNSAPNNCNQIKLLPSNSLAPEIAH
ncbi:lipase family protein [Acinetobacter sp.]|jgi:triacylglycerol lipase|uniref:lipase family protein n=1 Tax=Acinetobacter TaxID=469 RepID=UPI000C438BB7|nr:lipase family protein [Acinetobacter sp.]MBC68984.1 triacylglycerol lipase [Acinetobacter sp.]|tara:strand:+ start:407 stop:1708 length:1302 start_codon:yes stop_codon:yes gene_type:complete